MSPVHLIGFVSVSLVMGVSGLRYVSAVMPAVTQPQAAKAETSEASASPASAVVDENNSSTTNQQSSSAASHASATVNGKTYTLLGDGELHETANGAHDQSSVDISVHSSDEGQRHNSASSHVHVSSHSISIAKSNRSTAP